VAVVGSTGSGKSTLLDLLLRFKDPTSGCIVIDGRRIERVSLTSLRAQVGWVPQEAMIFDGTLRENIAYGVRRPPSTVQLRQAIRRAGLREVVARLKGGLNGRVGSSGQDLSHGERQRVVLARALIADPPILVVDELSPGADAESSERLAVLLRTLANEKTVIVVTHQPSVLRAADRIYVLRRGRRVDRGTHTELLERSATYRRLMGAAAPQEPQSAVPDTDLSDESLIVEASVSAR
jgi:ABC-type multidrug transport system fused ATPase/permease subunit